MASYKKIAEKFWSNLKEITMMDILNLKTKGNVQKLNEASLGRVYQHFLKSKEQSFGIITAWRTAELLVNNQVNMEKLKNTLRSQKFGYFKLRGVWMECTEVDQNNKPIPYNKCAPDKLKQSSEPSFFVIGCTKKDVLKWVQKYKQDAAVYSGPESKGHILLIFGDGSESDLGRKFNANGISQGLSRVKGRQFFFEYDRQGGWGEAMCYYAYEKSSKDKKGE